MADFSTDINNKVNQKLASLFSDAGIGALLMGTAALPSAALSGYANDRPIKKQLAETESWALPTGAVLGALGLPAYRGMRMASDTVDSIAATAPEALEALKSKLTPVVEEAMAAPGNINGASSALNNVADRLSAILAPIEGVGSALGKNLARMGLIR